eukprot:284817156_5
MTSLMTSKSCKASAMITGPLRCQEDRSLSCFHVMVVNMYVGATNLMHLVRVIYHIFTDNYCALLNKFGFDFLFFPKLPAACGIHKVIFLEKLIRNGLLWKKERRKRGHQDRCGGRNRTRSGSHLPRRFGRCRKGRRNGRCPRFLRACKLEYPREGRSRKRCHSREGRRGKSDPRKRHIGRRRKNWRAEGHHREGAASKRGSCWRLIRGSRQGTSRVRSWQEGRSQRSREGRCTRGNGRCGGKDEIFSRNHERIRKGALTKQIDYVKPVQRQTMTISFYQPIIVNSVAWSIDNQIGKIFCSGESASSIRSSDCRIQLGFLLRWCASWKNTIISCSACCQSYSCIIGYEYQLHRSLVRPARPTRHIIILHAGKLCTFVLLIIGLSVAARFLVTSNRHAIKIRHAFRVIVLVVPVGIKFVVSAPSHLLRQNIVQKGVDLSRLSTGLNKRGTLEHVRRRYRVEMRHLTPEKLDTEGYLPPRHLYQRCQHPHHPQLHAQHDGNDDERNHPESKKHAELIGPNKRDNKRILRVIHRSKVKSLHRMLRHTWTKHSCLLCLSLAHTVRLILPYLEICCHKFLKRVTSLFLVPVFRSVDSRRIRRDILDKTCMKHRLCSINPVNKQYASTKHRATKTEAGARHVPLDICMLIALRWDTTKLHLSELLHSRLSRKAQ